jgi:hypothetical protein
MPRLHNPRAFAAALLAASLLSAPAFAETLHFKASLNGASEVPPTDSKGTGAVVATLDTATKMLDYTLTFENLTGPATAAHFHGPAPVGKNAGVQVPIGSAGMTSPVHGMATLSDQQITELKSGDMYVNVHTKAHPGGEIRGQVMSAK